MSKNTGKKKVGAEKKRLSNSAPDASRRRFVYIGLGALAAAGAGSVVGYRMGWFDDSPASVSSSPETGAGNVRMLSPAQFPADAQNALRACDEMVTHYAHELKNASSVIHAVRGFGRNFLMGDGSRAVDFLCSRFPAEREVNGSRRVYFPREAEVHDNSFLKTFLEAGVSVDQQVIVGATRYTLRDVSNSAKALFRCDPNNLYRYDQTLLHEHLPWGLIAFSILVPPSEAGWVNAWGETIELPKVIDRALAEYERTCALTQEQLLRGEPESPEFRTEMKKYSCFGLHALYAFLACLKNGYRNDNIPGRLAQQMDLLTYRLKADADAIVGEYAAEGRGAPSIVVEGLQQRALAKLYGHAFEAINYVKLHRLLPFSAGQERRIQAAEGALYSSITKLRAMDWAELSRTVDTMLRRGQGEKFINDIVIALGHASRGMKLLTPQNPDAPEPGALSN
ncbi:MAG: hypothetical protein KIT57_00015 [Blastocatellales bacterium]|nr:hypothetical protein [Blastocatellales bacterium]